MKPDPQSFFRFLSESHSHDPDRVYLFPGITVNEGEAEPQSVDTVSNAIASIQERAAPEWCYARSSF